MTVCPYCGKADVEDPLKGMTYDWLDDETVEIWTDGFICRDPACEGHKGFGQTGTFRLKSNDGCWTYLGPDGHPIEEGGE